VLVRCCSVAEPYRVPSPIQNVHVPPFVIVVALHIVACTPGAPIRGWNEIAEAEGSVPNHRGVVECMSQSPCPQVQTDEFSTSGRPLRLVCTGPVDLQFTEYFHGPEPASGNAWTCPSQGTSAILLVPSGSAVSFYLSAVRVREDIAGTRLPWSVAVLQWEGLWRKPDCGRKQSGTPRGPWALCGDEPLGIALPAPTPA
jgi:hypothetical protein